jgi:hypothetical protein
VGLGGALQSMLGRSRVYVEAQVGEHPRRTVERMAERIGRHPDATRLVLWTGANANPNDPVAMITAVGEAANLGHRLMADQTLRRGIGAWPVIVVGVPPSWGDTAGFNSFTFDSSGRYQYVSPDVASELMASDGLHMRQSGYLAVADEVAVLGE